MGLIQAAIGAFSGTIADNWKDYFVCDSLNNNILVVKGHSKSKGLLKDSDVITNGSGIVVGEGQCAIIVDDGQVLEVAAQPGMYTFDTSKSPSIFDGGLQGLKDSFNEALERFSYGGIAAKKQVVYYINTKEITGNLFGTATPIPFRVYDSRIGLDIDASLRCNGEYSFRIVNPLAFFKNVAGDQADGYRKENLEQQMRSEFMTALQPALAEVSTKGVRYHEVPAHTFELCEALNAVLSARWQELRGIAVVSVGINSLSLSKEDEDQIKALQRAAALRDPSMMAANLAAAQMDAMRDAAKNAAGAGVGFMNMNMAGSGVGSVLAETMKQGNKAEQWTCSCGNLASGNFCSQCGNARVSKSFCSQCGAPLEAGAAFCSQCGAKRS